MSLSKEQEEALARAAERFQARQAMPPGPMPGAMGEPIIPELFKALPPEMLESMGQSGVYADFLIDEDGDAKKPLPPPLPDAKEQDGMIWPSARLAEPN